MPGRVLSPACVGGALLLAGLQYAAQWPGGHCPVRLPGRAALGSMTMPWTPDEMGKKGAKRPSVAAKVANAAYRRCMAAGGSDKTCAPKAIRMGLAVSNAGHKEQ